MKKRAISFCLPLAVALVCTLYEAGSAARAACTNCTQLGIGALGAVTTADNDSAFGFDALGSNTTGSGNTAVGESTLVNNTSGGSNTGTGADALAQNRTGSINTATGLDALVSNTIGSENTATGAQALNNNTTGNNNTATGVIALFNNNGSFNTGTGEAALYSNASGFDNTADGYQALYGNTTGYYNTATGMDALQTNSTGIWNTADGMQALKFNTTGSRNTAMGLNSLAYNTTGSSNTAAGTQALGKNTTGVANIGLGYLAGANLTTGSSNIDIGNPGAAAESNTIRIGTQGTQTATYVAGIAGVSVSGSDVVVSSLGRLGVVVSSARFKRDVHDMGEASDNVLKLRPVTFRYKEDRAGMLQYGLIAEEVERLYPELVTRGADGQIESVRYSMLTGMLINELKKQEQKIESLSARAASADREITQLRASQVRQRIEFQEKFALLQRALAARDNGGKLTVAISTR